MTKTIKLVILLGLVGFLIYMFVKNNNNENFKAVEGFDDHEGEEKDNEENEVEAVQENNQPLDSNDLLPVRGSDEENIFDDPQGDLAIDQQNLVTTDKYSIGVNTVGQSLRNASYDIRSAPANPKNTVSPWLQSTIEPDINIKNLMDC